MPFTILHLNAGTLHKPPFPSAACHCLTLVTDAGVTLVDTGIGLRDVADPERRVGRDAIDAAGFQFDPAATLARQLGDRAAAVTDIVLTHGDPDHAGGLADFPAATVHVSSEERAAIAVGGPRYRAAQFDHGPRWREHGPASRRWFGLEARPVEVAGGEVLLVPLFGHTRGHCGVAVPQGGGWLLHVGDAYYLRGELDRDDHPASALAAVRADDDPQRRATLAELRRLARDHGDAVATVGYHDFGEFPRVSDRPDR